MSVWKDKKREVWMAKFMFQNIQYKREGFETRADALTWEVKKRDELKNPPEPKPIRLTFSQASTKYLEDCKARFQCRVSRFLRLSRHVSGDILNTI